MVVRQKGVRLRLTMAQYAITQMAQENIPKATHERAEDNEGARGFGSTRTTGVDGSEWRGGNNGAGGGKRGGELGGTLGGRVGGKKGGLGGGSGGGGDSGCGGGDGDMRRGPQSMQSEP